VVGDGGERDRSQPHRQRRGHDDQAHRLVHDHRFQRTEAKQADQKRQTKLRSAQANQPAQRPDACAAEEGANAASSGVFRRNSHSASLFLLRYYVFG
jgi:hypothetical protein